MGKNINYTEENLFDIKCLRESIRNQIKECEIQKRILNGQIETLTSIIDSLDRHISSIENENK